MHKFVKECLDIEKEPYTEKEEGLRIWSIRMSESQSEWVYQINSGWDSTKIFQFLQAVIIVIFPIIIIFIFPEYDPWTFPWRASYRDNGKFQWRLREN